MDNKVYCSECVYFIYEYDFDKDDEVCDNPENIKSGDTYYSRKIVTKYGMEPKDINKLNNCGWFKKKHVLPHVIKGRVKKYLEGI